MPVGHYDRKKARRPKKYVRHTPEEKAAVLAALLAGQGVCEIAEQHNLTVSQVSSWKNELTSEQITAIQTKNREEFEELIRVFVREALTTMACQVRFFRDERWLRSQDAAAAGTLFGITTDKVVRLLQANQAAIEAAAGAGEPDRLEAVPGSASASIQ